MWRPRRASRPPDVETRRESKEKIMREPLFHSKGLRENVKIEHIRPCGGRVGINQGSRLSLKFQKAEGRLWKKRTSRGKQGKRGERGARRRRVSDG